MREKRFGELTELPSGRYRARYRYKGKRYSAPGTFSRKIMAEKWLLEQKAAIELGEWVEPGGKAPDDSKHQLTVGEWLVQWLEIRKSTWRISTYEKNVEMFRRRVFEVEGDAAKLKDIPLIDLRRRDIAEWWDAVNLRYGRQTYNYTTYKRIKTALSAAVERELIDATPATLNLKGQVPQHKKKELPTTDQMRAIYEAMPARYQLVTALTFFHGMRIGEVLALRVKDIEDTGTAITVHVRGTAYRKPGVGMIRQEGAKTASGNRSVPVFEPFFECVRTHLGKYTGGAPDDMLCVTRAGRTLMDTTYRSRLATAKKRAGLEHLEISPHYGRVWLITQLVEAGMTIPAIGEILGQRDLKTITEVYMRTSEERKREALDKVSGIF